MLLILRALKLGDLLVAVPALRALRRHYPGHRILYAGPAWLAPILELTGCVDELLDVAGLEDPLPVPASGSDVVVNLHGRGPQSHHRLDALEARERIGYAAAGWFGPAWQEDLHERVRWTNLLNWYGIPADPLDFRLLEPTLPSACPGAVVVHPGAAYGSRLWPAERFVAVVRKLSTKGHQVVLTGSSGERERVASIASEAGLPASAVLAGELELGEFAAVIAGAALVISADTGAAHLASAYARPSVTIFGPAPSQQWGPPAGPHIVLTDESLRVGELFGSTPDPALLAIQPAQVLAAASTLGAY